MLEVTSRFSRSGTLIVVYVQGRQLLGLEMTFNYPKGHLIVLNMIQNLGSSLSH